MAEEEMASENELLNEDAKPGVLWLIMYGRDTNPADKERHSHRHGPESPQSVPTIDNLVFDTGDIPLVFLNHGWFELTFAILRDFNLYIARIVKNIFPEMSVAAIVGMFVLVVAF